jgi:diguanylate cyclase (GGDEF)-like protein
MQALEYKDSNSHTTVSIAEWEKKQQVQLLFDNSLSANLVVISAAVFFYIILSDSALSKPIGLWTLSISLFSCLRLYLWWRYRQNPFLFSIDAWARRYILATLLVGINWAMLAIFVVLTDDLMTNGLVFILILGATAASATVLSSLMPAFYAYVLPMTITGSLGFALQGGDTSLWIGLGLPIYAMMIARTARNANLNLTRFLRLQYENQSLIEQLSGEVAERKSAQHELKQYSEQLEKLVDERTSQLVRINRSLENEINERRRAEENLQHLAHHDALTNLPNRLLLDARLNHAIERSRRQNKNLAVLFMDLDGFKHVNDSLGHQVGDELLCMVADRLKQCIREEDTVARLGGDEFVVVMGEVEDNSTIEKLAKKLMERLENQFSINRQSVYIGTSIGISLYPKNGESAEELLTNADAAMYRAKEMGRHNFQFYAPDMTEAAYDRVMLESALRTALDEQQFLLYYQPQIDLADGRVCGVEALIRWRHPELGILTPVHFIQAAEDSGLIIPIGEWVLHEACSQMARWKSAGLQLNYMAINLAGPQIHEGTLLSRIEQVIEQTGCDASWLELEITETFIMQRIGQAIETLDNLKQLGVSMAIDDFGTGYSSLSYLRRLPIDKLKIDRSFIRDITTDPNDAAIVHAIIALGKSLNLEVIAEGVETQQQEVFLKQLGCDQGQGYYIGYPQPADEVEKVLAGN